MKPGQVDHFCSAGTEHYNKSHLNTVQVQTKIYLSKRRPSNRCCCKLLLLVASLGWNSQGEWQKMIIEAWSQQTRINKFNLLKCRSHCFTIGSQVTADELATKLSWLSSLFFIVQDGSISFARTLNEEDFAVFVLYMCVNTVFGWAVFRTILPPGKKTVLAYLEISTSNCQETSGTTSA